MSLNTNIMPNALIKQRESIGYVDTILKGIHEIDEAKVFGGLKRLRNIDFSNLETPLSPSFDLITGISPGREDFLTLELKHLLALVIRHMAQGVYQWTQQQNKGVANVTQKELTTSLGKLIALLEPTKDPCIAAITNLHCAKAIANCLAMPASTTGDEWWDRLIFVTEFITFVDKSIEEGKVGGIDTALSLLQRLYKGGAAMLKEANAQTLVMQIAAVDAWQRIMHAGSNVKEQKEQIRKTLEGLKQYFEEGVLGQENKLHKATRMFKKAKDAIASLMQAAPSYRKCLIEVLYKKIAALEDNLDNQDAGQDRNIIEALRNIAFHALVDLYVETADESVRCEILKVFGALARCLCKQGSLSADRLNSLIGKKKVDTIEQAALRILVEAIWPTVFENENDPVALSLTSGKAVELSPKWQIQCTAIEELLRFEAHYLKHKGDESTKEAKTPITSFLDEMGKEYQVTALLVNKFNLSKNKITRLRDFLHHAKGLDKARELLRTAFSLQEKDIEKLEKREKWYSLMEESKKNTVKELLAPGFEKKGIKAESQEKFLKYLLKKDKNDALEAPFRELAELKIEPSDIDLIRDFLREKISQKELATKEQNIKQWLGEKLNLQGKECDTLIQFLQKHKAQQAAQPQQEKYSKEPVRPVLDKLIDQFNLTKAERDLIDETIFQGKSSDTAKESLIAKVGAALKNFFGQDNYPKIACAFNNLDRIRAMIKEEKLLLGKGLR